MQTELRASDPKQVSLHGRRLTVAINGKTINVNALADELGMDQSNLSKFLSGKRDATNSYARRVAHALGITLDDLFQSIDTRRLQKTA